MKQVIIFLAIWSLEETLGLALRAQRPPGSSCHEPLGLSYEAIHPVTQFELTATNGVATGARLNGPEAWRPPSVGCNTHIQINLSRPLLVTGIQTQGDPDSQAWVKTFRVAFSPDCVTFASDDVSYLANLDNRSITTRLFHHVTVAKCVRIYPEEGQGSPLALRLELLGCDLAVCQQRLTEEDSDWRDIRFQSEKIVTKLSIKTGYSKEPEILYSRACANFSHLSSQEISVVSHVIYNQSERSLDITFSRPVRAQCLRLTIPEDVPLTSVASFGCGIVKAETESPYCGHTRRTSSRRRKRVVGGESVVPGDWPWLVSLHFLKWHNFTNSSGVKHLCGGSLIRPQWVLTAAHCLDNDTHPGLASPDNWVVALGEHDQSSLDGTEQLHRISQIIRHPDFKISDGPILYDIALVKLAEPAILSDYVNVVCLDAMGDFLPGTHCTVAGWGQDTNDTPGTKLPFKTVLPVMDSKECSNKYTSLPVDHAARASVLIDDSVLCASEDGTGRDACFGDSGGPLFCEKDHRWFQMGIVSLGYICGDHTYPGIYTRVSHYHDWIENTIQTDSFQK